MQVVLGQWRDLETMWRPDSYSVHCCFYYFIVLCCLK